MHASVSVILWREAFIVQVYTNTKINTFLAYVSERALPGNFF